MSDSFLVYLFAADDPRMDYRTPRKSNSKASASIQEHPQTNQPAAAVPGPHEATDFSPADIEMARDIFMSVSLQMEKLVEFVTTGQWSVILISRELTVFFIMVMKDLLTSPSICSVMTQESFMSILAAKR